MPYQLFDEGIGLLFRFRGVVTLKNIMTANTEGWEHPRWDKHRYQIWDFGNVDTMTLDEGEALLVARMDNVAFRITEPMKGAFIANSEHIINMCEKYIMGIEIENLEVRLFGDEAEARKWVDV